jgi:hypothetical protein
VLRWLDWRTGSDATLGDSWKDCASNSTRRLNVLLLGSRDVGQSTRYRKAECVCRLVWKFSGICCQPEPALCDFVGTNSRGSEVKIVATRVPG